MKKIFTLTALMGTMFLAKAQTEEVTTTTTVTTTSTAAITY